MVHEARSPSPALSPSFEVLVVEPDEKLSAEILSALEEAVPGTTSAVARSVSEAQHLVIAQKPDLFVLDVDTASDSAQEFIYDLRTSHPSARAIVLTASHFKAQREPIAGLGAMHFLEKPFPRLDFMALAEALLDPTGSGEGEHFQGTLSELHIADIIQLKCISGATSMLEFTGPRGEKARVYFENGQVRHATAPGKEGREAFNQIVDWKGGVISEVPVPEETPRTITLDWQVLLMEAVRSIDEMRGGEAEKTSKETPEPREKQTILVIDDSLMLLSFVKEILMENSYHVVAAATAEEGLRASHTKAPSLILLDYILPDMRGDEVCRKLVANTTTSKIPVVYMSGFGSELHQDRSHLPNVIGSLSKPFTSELLVSSVASYLKNGAADAKPAKATEKSPPTRFTSGSLGGNEVKPPEKAVSKEPEPRSRPVLSGGRIVAQEAKSLNFDNPPADLPITAQEPKSPGRIKPNEKTAGAAQAHIRRQGNKVINFEQPVLALSKKAPASPTPPGPPVPSAPAAPAAPVDSSNAYFCGDASFFSLHWALQTIAREKLTGMLQIFWSRATVELLARAGRVILVTTRHPQVYCEEAPVTLLDVDPARVEAARKTQSQTGCPLFVTLAQENLILREPGLQLVQHYGQKLFAQLWNAERVRFIFEQQPVPGYARELPGSEGNMDQWALSTLRFVQYQELGKRAMVDPTSVPAYTREGHNRVQQLRLTVAEAQFASQFNGTRSVAQISKNLRLDIKFARLTLFRFLALEIVECWPEQVARKPETRSGLRGIFGR